MKTIKTLIIAVLILVIATPTTFAKSDVDSTLKFATLSAGIQNQSDGLRVNLVNTNNEDVILVIRDNAGTIVYKKKMGSKAFSSSLLKKPSKLKAGNYVAEFNANGKTIRKSISI